MVDFFGLKKQTPAYVFFFFFKMQTVPKGISEKVSLLLSPVLRPLSPAQKLSLLPAQISYMKVGEGQVYSIRHSVSCFYLVKNASSSLFPFLLCPAHSHLLLYVALSLHNQASAAGRLGSVLGFSVPR